MKVGFIGLGSMGLLMAQKIQADGHELTLYARRTASLEPFADEDITVATTPAELAVGVAAVGICVYDAQDVEDVVFGPQGLVEGCEPGIVLLVHSTIGPDQIRDVAERPAAYGMRVLDVPVTRRGLPARTDELTIMIGGDSDTLADVRDLLSSLSEHVVHLGGIGAASSTKLINNTMFSAQIALADDAMRAGESFGVDAARLAEVLLSSSSACGASSVRLIAGSIKGVAQIEPCRALLKDVTLMASSIGDAPGRELVDVAQRFVHSMRAEQHDL